VIVTVEDAQVVTVERVELDVLRWARVDVDCTDATADAVPSLMRASLVSAWQNNAAGLPLVARVSLTGQTMDAGALHDGVSSLRDDARAVSASISPDLFIERVKVLVTPPAQTQQIEIGDDFASLIRQASTDPNLAALLAADLAPFVLAAQTALGPSLEEADDEGLRRSASDGDWTAVLEKATLALRSRLAGQA